ncbi:hypothetical protein EON64_12325 [archaeon]|nr:MAG: hypothetical protein EON64_12325 [archaeon]
MGASGVALTMVVRPLSPAVRFPVCLATDICGGDSPIGYTQEYRFLLSGEDIRGILQTSEKLARFSSTAQQTLRQAENSPVPRLAASLIGTSVMQQSITMSFGNMAFFIAYGKLEERRPVDMVVAAIQAQQLHRRVAAMVSADVEGIKADFEDPMDDTDEL